MKEFETVFVKWVPFGYARFILYVCYAPFDFLPRIKRGNKFCPV